MQKSAFQKCLTRNLTSNIIFRNWLKQRMQLTFFLVEILQAIFRAFLYTGGSLQPGRSLQPIADSDWLP